MLLTGDANLSAADAAEVRRIGAEVLLKPFVVGVLVALVDRLVDDGLDSVADSVLKVPQTGNPYLNALMTIVPLQLFAYHMALVRGCEIDQPRNLAKSVTVE